MSKINSQILKEIMPELTKFLASEGQQWKEERKEKVGYFQVMNLQRALDHIQGLKDILKTLGLLNMESLLD